MTAAQKASSGVAVIQALAAEEAPEDRDLAARVSVLLRNMVEASRLEKRAQAEGKELQ